MMKRLPSPTCYAIGWISTRPVERAAAIAFLDECHDTPDNFSQHPRDDNSYAWGRMGGHDIVIASLPAGSCGMTAASVTASGLIASLPHIRSGLLVGIGGALAQPEQGRDIRLGDVVVSEPCGTVGGVVQYDFGKALRGGVWERIGALNLPPFALLSAVAALQAEHLISNSIIPSLIQSARQSTLQLRDSSEEAPDFTHPGAEHDRLFQSTYDHDGGDSCTHCDATQQVEREPRDQSSPRLHYGVIASGNTIVRDADIRDRLIEDIGLPVMCVETEAAGVMNHFPCLVVRGISNYADSHSNDKWEKYASGTAAAFAKELLGYVPRR